MTRGDVMSKTELLLSKLRNISVLVSIGAFAFFVIALTFAVINDSIDLGNGFQIDSGYQSILLTLLILFIVSIVAARVIDLFLQRESKLMDVNEYRQSLQRKEEVSFSETKIYSDIIRTKKSRYTEMSSNGDEEEHIEEIEETKIKSETESELKTKIDKTKLSFFARKKLEESMRQKEVSKDLIVEDEEKTEEFEELEEIEDLELKQSFMDKVKDINWMFWKKDSILSEDTD